MDGDRSWQQSFLSQLFQMFVVKAIRNWDEPLVETASPILSRPISKSATPGIEGVENPQRFPAALNPEPTHMAVS